jgi:hypothetical protein
MFLRLLWAVAAVLVGIVVVSLEFKFRWHTICFWFYPLFFVYQTWYAWNDAISFALGFFAMAGWVKLNGDIEEKSKITIFSPEYFRRAYHRGSRALLGSFYGVCYLLINGVPELFGPCIDLYRKAKKPHEQPALDEANNAYRNGQVTSE